MCTIMIGLHDISPIHLEASNLAASLSRLYRTGSKEEQTHEYKLMQAGTDDTSYRTSSSVYF